MVLGETMMFEYLSVYDKILVTGPQRSGTRIAAKMIAQDTGYIYLDEHEFGTRDRERFEHILSERSQIVVQCPAMCWCIHEYANDSSIVVLMIRDTDDIVASEKRVHWKHGPYYELMNYGFSSRGSVSFRRRGGHVAPIKYACWLTRQRRHIEHYIELEYASLSEHPLWIPKALRVDFGVEQTELANET